MSGVYMKKICFRESEISFYQNKTFVTTWAKRLPFSPLRVSQLLHVLINYIYHCSNNPVHSADPKHIISFLPCRSPVIHIHPLTHRSSSTSSSCSRCRCQPTSLEDSSRGAAIKKKSPLIHHNAAAPTASSPTGRPSTRSHSPLRDLKSIRCPTRHQAPSQRPSPSTSSPSSLAAAAPAS
jgi:hypothetical protein